MGISLLFLSGFFSFHLLGTLLSYIVEWSLHSTPTAALWAKNFFFSHFLVFHFHYDTNSLLTTVWSNYLCVSLPDYTFLKCHLGHAIPGGLPNNIWTCHQGLWWLCPASFLSLSPGSVCTLWCCPAGPPRSQDTLPPHLPCPTSVLSCCGAHGPWSTPTFPEGLSWFSTTHWLGALLSSDPYFICF